MSANVDKFNIVLFIDFKGVFVVSIENKNQQGENPPNKKRKKANCFKKISHWFESDYKFWGELVKFLITGVVLGTGLNLYIDWRNQQADQLTYEQGLVNTYMEDVKGLLLKEYRSPSKSLDPEITHAEIANFVASKTSSLLKSITDAEQRQRLINFLKYSSIATMPDYLYSLHFPDNICSRVSKVKSRYYVDFLCTLNLTNDQKTSVGDDKNDNKSAQCPAIDKKRRIDLSGINLSNMILEDINFREINLENSVFSLAQLDHAFFDNTILDQSIFLNTDLQYASMNCTQLKKVMFSISFLKEAILSRANLSEAELVGSNLRNAKLYNANLSSAYLGVNRELYQGNIPTRNITDLRGADLSDANLSGAELVKVDLRRANLERVRYKDFYLTFKTIECKNSIIDLDSYNKLSPDFKKHCLLKVIASERDLKDTNLSGFDLSSENLKGADLKGADLRKTDLRGTDLTGIKFNSDTNFEDAIYDETTTLPKELKDILEKLKELKYSPKEELKNLLENLEESKNLPKEELKNLLENLKDTPKDEPKYSPKDELTKLLEKLKDLPKEELTKLLEKLKDTPKEKLKDLPKEEKENLQSLLELQKMLVFNSLVKITDYDKVPQETLPNNTDLSFIDLQYANLSKSNLTGINLLISNLSYARLFKATLTKANLEKANLTRANLEKATLIAAKLKGANLIDSNLRKAILTNADLQEALLIRADLRGARLSQAILERLPKLDNAIYDDATELPFSDKMAKGYGMWKIAPGSDLKGAILRGVDLRGANLCDAVIDDKTRLDGALFNEKTQLPKRICVDKDELTEEIIDKAQDEYNMIFIPSNDWKRRDKSLLKLGRANLPGVQFTNANLSGADLSGANLRGTYWTADGNLKEAKFTGADLRNATFKGVDLSGVDFAEADLRGADLSKAVHLSPKKLKDICHDKLTQFPEGIKPPSDPVCKS